MASKKKEKEMSWQDWDKKLKANYERNKSYSKPADSYNTPLNSGSEIQFRHWLAQNKVPFNTAAKQSDYDMRGFWLALQSKDPKAVSAVNPIDKRIHYPDYWKTPYHESFSAESQWADKGAPTWDKGGSKLVGADGKVVFDQMKATQ